MVIMKLEAYFLMFAPKHLLWVLEVGLSSTHNPCFQQTIRKENMENYQFLQLRNTEYCMDMF